MKDQTNNIIPVSFAEPEPEPEPVINTFPEKAILYFSRRQTREITKEEFEKLAGWAVR